MAQADEVDNSYLQVIFLHCKIIDSCTQRTTGVHLNEYIVCFL